VKKFIAVFFGTEFTGIKVKDRDDDSKYVSPKARTYRAEASHWLVMNDNSMIGSKDAQPIGLFSEDSVEAVKKLLFLLSGESEVPESKHSPGFMKCGKYSARLVPAMNAEMVDRILADRQEQDQKNSEEIAE
jgi:hypothetical protein